MTSKYAIVSGVLFVVVALLHIVRALNQWTVHIGMLEIPIWVSWIAAAVTGGLGTWAFRSGSA
jgi:uncharacterized integral membrane protein